MHEVWRWGRSGGGGYYTLLVDDEGNVGIPAGRGSYERVARYAPDEVVDKVLTALKAERDRRRKADSGGGR